MSADHFDYSGEYKNKAHWSNLYIARKLPVSPALTIKPFGRYIDYDCGCIKSCLFTVSILHYMHATMFQATVINKHGYNGRIFVFHF